MTKHKNKIRRALRRMIEKRTRRALRSKVLRRARNRFDAQRTSAAPTSPDVGHLLRRARRRQQVLIELPAELTLYDRFEGVVKVVDEIRLLATKQSKQVVLNFGETKHIGPAALLVLLAEIYRCRMIEPHAADVTGTYPTDGDLERMLQDTGFFDVLSVKKRLPRQDQSFPMEYIKFRTGTRAVGEVAYELQRALFGEAIQLDEAAKQKLYRGLTEAMTNVVQHAYPEYDAMRAKLKNRWWLVGHINRDRKDLTVLIYDQGVGIPKTLPKNYSADLVNRTLSLLGVREPQDGEYIRAAMEIGRSKTKEAHRGRGLADFRGLVDRAAGASLKILSNRGYYEYFNGGKEIVKNSRLSLGGTLIQWRVPLASFEALGAGDMP